MTPLDIILADDDIIILNKPAGLLSVPGRYIPESAFSLLAEQFGELHVIHRLDRDTSGIIVFARHKAALTHVQQQFEKQKTRKVYECLVIGQLKGTWGCVNLPICVDWPNRPLQKISHVNGRYALTRWKRLAQDEETTRVEMYPKTGRSHQLRLHMLNLGHPIVGDVFYAGESAKEQPRMMLHARELDFTHPGSGEALQIVCPTPF
ncbi:RluA family pseudouridine synthase [Thalassolituus hydrocarboniclasticus]|uniref:RluA family pseudouridine synthase n=1 Tax=Thalassolituus hydrocarboniclasticus TaxID=2742796 RepID=A0ABY6A9Q2_9GAMM|nr:RluA family pseudouridine synthase [Thalassolituus hydrocarboniclasticus]UXD87568.1 RluA family pseudouridine synthase [Thalassolituus hydrocarboniclasticus]